MDGTRDASDPDRPSNPSGHVATIDSIDATDVHRIEFTVDWPPGHVAAYLVGGPEPLLIDAGMAGERGYNELVAGFDGTGYEIADVSHLLLTHPHVDHLGQVGEIVAAADPMVYAPAGVRKRFARDPADLARAVETNARAAGLVGEQCDRAVGMAVDSLERNRDLLAPSAVDRWIGADASADERGTPVEERVGDRTFTAIPTPGHQADHHCYETAIDGERALFAGDIALAPFRPVLLHVGLDTGVEEGIGAFERSLDRLATRSVERVFPGHGPIHSDLQETLDRDRRSLRRLVEGLARRLDTEGDAGAAGDAVAGGDGDIDGDGTAGRTAADLARERASGKRDFAYLLPEVVAALSRLVATGRARISTDETGTERYYPA